MKKESVNKPSVEKIESYSACALTLLIIANTLGYCLFLLPSILNDYNISSGGSKFSSLFLLPLSFLLVIPTAISYTCLNKIYPGGYGDITYLTKGYNRFLAACFSFGSILFFLPGCIAISINLIAQTVIKENDTFSNHKILKYLFNFTSLFKFISLIAVFLLNVSNFSLSIKLQAKFSFLRCIMIMIFVIIALFVNLKVIKKSENVDDSVHVPKHGTIGPVFGFFKALLMCASSFDGFNTLNFISYRIKNTKKNLFLWPVISSMMFELVIFILVCYSFFTVLDVLDGDIIRKYFDHLQFFSEKAGKSGLGEYLIRLRWFPACILVLTITGIMNGCIIILRSLIISYTSKYLSICMATLCLITFIFTFFEILDIMLRLGFLTNVWYFLSVSTLVFGKKSNKNEKGNDRSKDHFKNEEPERSQNIQQSEQTHTILEDENHVETHSFNKENHQNGDYTTNASLSNGNFNNMANGREYQTSHHENVSRDGNISCFHQSTENKIECCENTTKYNQNNNILDFQNKQATSNGFSTEDFLGKDIKFENEQITTNGLLAKYPQTQNIDPHSSHSFSFDALSTGDSQTQNINIENEQVASRLEKTADYSQRPMRQADFLINKCNRSSEHVSYHVDSESDEDIHQETKSGYDTNIDQINHTIDENISQKLNIFEKSIVIISMIITSTSAIFTLYLVVVDK